MVRRPSQERGRRRRQQHLGQARKLVPRETVRSAQLDFIPALVVAAGVMAVLPQRVVQDRHLTSLVALPQAGNDLR